MNRPEGLRNEPQVQDPNKRHFFQRLLLPATAGGLALLASERYFRGFAAADGPGMNPADGRVPFEHGKYQLYQRWVEGRGGAEREHHLIDEAPLGIDVDKLIALDFEGRINTGALRIHAAEGEATESRVVMLIRPGTLKYVQFHAALGGDRWDLFKIPEHGGDPLLDKIARFHAEKTARPWQDVYYLGDLGLFEEEWGHQEQELLHRIIRAQLPPRVGILEMPVANPHLFR